MKYPDAVDPHLVGTYPAVTKSGGGYVWDAVLEYRVWCHPEHDAPNLAEGSDYYHPFATFREAQAFADANPGSEEPLALVLQEEYIDEPRPGEFVHVRSRRITEWPVTFLSRPRRTPRTLAMFFAPDAPANRLDVVRGLAPDLSARDQA